MNLDTPLTLGMAVLLLGAVALGFVLGVLVDRVRRWGNRCADAEQAPAQEAPPTPDATINGGGGWGPPGRR